MNTIISDYLSNLKFGELQKFKNMAVIPLLTSLNHIPKYIALKEALEKRLITVTEVSRSGSVPTLKVKNKAEIPVLLLAGEELVGAKQNRILNTTILLKKHSETIIPVSCTEVGRWSYVSREFNDSDVIVSPKLRRLNVVSVADSLQHSGRFESDQGAVWGEIHEISTKARVQSPTGAMKDVFVHRENDLNDYLDAFTYVPQQEGLFVFISGKAVGFDFISLESAYEKVHLKLVKSYAMDALLQSRKIVGKPSIDKAKDFIKETLTCKEKKYKSVGHGWDYRFIADTVVGSALVYRKKAIHMAFFRTTKNSNVGKMPGYKRRRDFIR